MNKIVTLLLLNCIAIIGFAQSPKRIIKKLGNDPVFYIDSINVDKSEMQKYNPGFRFADDVLLSPNGELRTSSAFEQDPEANKFAPRPAQSGSPLPSIL